MPRLVITSLLVTVFVLAGCGVKGPPVPPKSLPVPKVAELVYRVDGSAVFLEWALTERLSGKQAQKATFGIYRFREELSESVCETCPLVFEKVDTVPYLYTDESRFSTFLELEGGYRYVFKVRLEIKARGGADSNLVRFDFP